MGLMMLNDLRRFATSAFPEDLRQAAWSEVLEKVRLRNGPTSPGQVALDGHVSTSTSSLHSVFVRLSATPQVLLPHCELARRHGQAVLVLALQAGSGLLSDAEETQALSPGDILLLDPTRPWRLEFHTDFRAVIVQLASSSFMVRLMRTCGQELNKVDTRSGVGAVALTLLQSLSDELEQLGPHELPPLEATLTELLVACLSRLDHRTQAGQAEDSTSVQLGHLRRVCRTIESRLSDAELQIDDIGRLEELSTRYIQKLFQVGGSTFSDYLKSRRLERCKLDLANPALAHVTIAELCFRWGFKDAAHFSRAFGARFGLSPKAFRAAPRKDEAEALQRGWPAQLPSGKAAAREGARPAADDAPARARRSEFQDVLTDHVRYATALALSPKRATAHALPGLAAGEPLPNHYYVPVSDKTVHWGYFSRHIKPVLQVRSGDVVTIETLTQHASDDRERMIDGDPGAESVFHWTADKKAVDRRGAGPMDASIYGRGAGEGFGVHICTGPIYVQEARPGDVLEIRILDILPRPSCHPLHHGRIFGSNAAAWWGFHYKDMLTEPKQREVVTIYEIEPAAGQPHAKAVYNFRWTPQTDPFGVRHDTIDYPGVPVDPSTVDKRYGVLGKVRVPIRPHFGVLAVAPREQGMVDSIPPSYFGGNLDNWRAGKGTQLYLPVSVDGALFSVGDPHASQGDSEVCGTAIECSLTGVFQLVLHKKEDLAGSFMADLHHPFLETPDEWVLQGLSFPNHFAELGPQAQTKVYQKASLDAAMRDAFRKTRHYLMQAHQLSEDEAISLMSVGVDFGITQVVDGNLGVHAIVKKALFPQSVPESAAGPTSLG
jgi:acetamidase/formamidase/AraC-like DNA-binding protein